MEPHVQYVQYRDINGVPGLQATAVNRISLQVQDPKTKLFRGTPVIFPGETYRIAELFGPEIEESSESRLDYESYFKSLHGPSPKSFGFLEVFSLVVIPAVCFLLGVALGTRA